MDYSNFEKWFQNNVFCVPFLNFNAISTYEERTDIVIMNCYGGQYHLYHKREYRLMTEKLSARTEIMGGKGSFFFLPIQRGISLENLCKAIKVGLEAYERNLHLILHCRSGLHRSEMIKCAIYFAVNAKHLQEIGKSNMLTENVQDKHNMFPVFQKELEEIIIKTKNEYDRSGK
jgi:hypothetical protein